VKIVNSESAPKTLKKTNHGGTENTEEHRVLLISIINLVALCLCGKKRLFGVDSMVNRKIVNSYGIKNPCYGVAGIFIVGWFLHL